jgi:hypothetical protein
MLKFTPELYKTTSQFISLAFGKPTPLPSRPVCPITRPSGGNCGGIARFANPAISRFDPVMPALALRPIGSNDYAEIDDGNTVGRIRYAAERTNETWMWNVTVLVPGGGNGTAPSLEAAKAAFRERWTKFKAEIGSEVLADALEAARHARERADH